MPSRKVRITLLLGLFALLVGTAMNASATTYPESLVWMEFKFRYDGQLDRSKLILKQVQFNVDLKKLPESQSTWVYGPILRDEPIDFDDEPVMGFPIMRQDLLEYTLQLGPLLVFTTDQGAGVDRRACDIEIKALAHLDGKYAEWRDPRWRLNGTGGEWGGNRGNCLVEITRHFDRNLLTVTIVVLD